MEGDGLGGGMRELVELELLSVESELAEERRRKRLNGSGDFRPDDGWGWG